MKSVLCETLHPSLLKQKCITLLINQLLLILSELFDLQIREISYLCASVSF